MTGPLIMLLGGGLGIGYYIYDWMQYRMRRRMRQTTSEEGLAGKVSYDWKVYAMIGLTLLISGLFARGIERVVQEPVEGFAAVTEVRRSMIVAIYILIVGLWWSIRQAQKLAQEQRLTITEQVAELVGSFRSVFRIRPTVFNALEEANRKVEPPVGDAVQHAVTTYYVTSLPRRAFDELRSRIDNPYMEQFIYILERGEDAKHEDMMKALNGLLERLKRAREIRDQSEVNMTVITGQTKIIQLIAVALVMVIGLVPMLRQAYEGAIGQMLFVFVATIGVAVSWFIDKRSASLKERVL